MYASNFLCKLIRLGRLNSVIERTVNKFDKNFELLLKLDHISALSALNKTMEKSIKKLAITSGFEEGDEEQYFYKHHNQELEGLNSLSLRIINIYKFHPISKVANFSLLHSKQKNVEKRISKLKLKKI